MKKITHAWLAFMATKRLEQANLSVINRRSSNSLITWFKNHKDDVIQGAWYPDSVIKDMANSHVFKIKPSTQAKNKFKHLPTGYLNYIYGKKSHLKNSSFQVEQGDNLPDRCESIAHSVIDHLKMQLTEDKGSPITPTSNQIALLLFMLSHYVADAHMPLHCDARRFSEGIDLHGYMEGKWDEMIKRYYCIDESNERFFYDPHGYPLRESSYDQEYQTSFLSKLENTLFNKPMAISWGSGNNNVWDFICAICQYSYLLSYYFISEPYDETNVTSLNWQSLGSISFKDLSLAVFSDTIDSIARIWFRVWRRYNKWEKKQRSMSRNG